MLLCNTPVVQLLPQDRNVIWCADPYLHPVALDA